MDQMKHAFTRASGGGPPVSPPPAGPPNGIAQVVTGLAVNAHYKVLILGQKGDNFPQAYREHPQIVLWGSDKKVIAENIPQAVRLVLTTRFNSHPDLVNIRRVCQMRGIPCPSKPYGTGEIKALLAPIMARVNGVRQPEPSPEPPPPKPKAEAEPDPAKPKTFGRHGMRLTTFILQHGDPFKLPHDVEGRRLHKLAEAEGYTTTPASITQAMYQLRKQLTPPKAVEPKAVVVEAPKVEAKPAKAAPKAEPPVVPPPVALPVPGSVSATLSDEDKAILQMLDEAARQIADVLAAHDLIRRSIVERAERRRIINEMWAKGI